MTLTQKQKLFVDVFDGDTVKSLRVAGYEGADSYLKQLGEQFLSDPLIQDAIRFRDVTRQTRADLVATRQERQILWTNIMKNEDPYKKPELDENGIPVKQEVNIPLPLRLKASELLGKSEADFVEKVDMSVQHSLSDLVMQSYQLKDSNNQTIEAIEAEYYRVKNSNESKPDILEEIEEFNEPKTLDDLI